MGGVFGNEGEGLPVGVGHAVGDGLADVEEAEGSGVGEGVEEGALGRGEEVS